MTLFLERIYSSFLFESMVTIIEIGVSINLVHLILL